MTRLLLVHIAKTGGTSLRRFFKRTPATATFDCLHNGNLLRFQAGKRLERKLLDPCDLEYYDVAIMMVRNPLDRLASCYRYFFHGGLNQRCQDLFPGDEAFQNLLQKQAPTLDACCQSLPQIAKHIPHFRPISDWLDPLPNPLAGLMFTGRLERFQSDLQRFSELLGLDPSAVVPEHVNRSQSVVEAGLNHKSIQCVERFYAADYRRFGYPSMFPSSPHLIQYWNEIDPPLFLLERMESWRKRHPGWGYCRYDRSSAAAFIGHHYGQALQDAFLDIRIPAMQADVFRIAALQAQGGVWIDAATCCLAPLECWLNRRQPLVLLRRAHQQHPRICTGFIHAADPGHPLLMTAWERISAALLARRGEKVYRDFGAGLIRDLLAEGDADLQAGLEVLAETDLQTQLSIGSSSEVIQSDQHWSERQHHESLYLSGGSPSHSQRLKESS